MPEPVSTEDLERLVSWANKHRPCRSKLGHVLGYIGETRITEADPFLEAGIYRRSWECTRCGLIVNQPILATGRP